METCLWFYKADPQLQSSEGQDGKHNCPPLPGGTLGGVSQGVARLGMVKGPPGTGEWGHSKSMNTEIQNKKWPDSMAATFEFSIISCVSK